MSEPIEEISEHESTHRQGEPQSPKSDLDSSDAYLSVLHTHDRIVDIFISYNAVMYIICH
jgi:hypothetical protein